MNDAAYYNAIAIALFADYVKIARAKKSRASWEAAWKAHPELHHSTNPERAWSELKKHGIALILREDEAYPPALKEIAQPPFALYVKGALPEKGVKMLAIVGTRRATAGGKDAARNFAEALAKAGWCIVSGLALGIDGAAHAGALETGSTVAVLACGLDTVYPSEHASLAERILKEGGALVSEYPIGGETLPYRFLERNRIVSGLSRGALIIEAPERSGSLATAKFALDQNREVFVTPGPLNHPNFAGSHALLKAGAALVTSPDDIRLAFGEDIAPKDERGAPELSGDELLVYETLKAAGNGATIDKLAEIANLPSYIVSRCLTFLQLKGIIRESGGTYELS